MVPHKKTETDQCQIRLSLFFGDGFVPDPSPNLGLGGCHLKLEMDLRSDPSPNFCLDGCEVKLETDLGRIRLQS